ncbi:TetM/TetW/TetO/TetS family tetracycline resistance ribosomal protection protein [Planococcus shenhongbingii]|uniref:GTP-binding protein n=1 Tax=Planococcus shenhongbingii TaxID=3058398 RepID=UPI00262AA6D9|nr:TetM/TetW/TetO/TetS family tetracycline resistance ribosomal protection protein [Planococcus sp. N016]WKA59677.1 TetM/TetW/TetO/TetS family tetracycline resistance ribosomal protection protein [Planococcus sp. N016]
MNKTIGILAHVDAGKTTFSEQLLYHAKSIRQRGRVDHQDAFLDSHEIEKNRGITIFADQAMFSYNDSTYYLIDTPGHVDFSAEMERAIQVLDIAIIIVSAVDGVEGHTETVWQLLKKYRVPTFFFINKTDREGAEVNRVLTEIRSSLTPDVFDVTASFHNGEMDDELIEFLAERNETLLEYYLNSGYDPELWLQTLRTMIRNQQFFAAAGGSALKDTGVIEFFDQIDQLTATAYSDEEEFAAQVYKIRHEANGNRLTFIKVLSGCLRVRDEVAYGAAENRLQEKATQLRTYNGHKFQPVEQARAGELVAVAGLSETRIGDGLGKLAARASFGMVPALKSKVLVDPAANIKEVLKGFMLLNAEDPSLRVIWDEHFQEIHIHVMGVIQLEILEQIVKERFGFQVSFGDPEILYKETIEQPVMGYGHFEPLRHYAEVHLKVEPAPRGSGITLANICHADALSIGNQNLVLHHLNERDHHGLLTGSALTDVKITLLTGRGHNQHTAGGDFREAAYRALRQGLEKAHNRLLEPVYHFKIKVEMDHMGKVLSDIQQSHGSFNAPELLDGKAFIEGRVPVVTFMNYSTEFASFTHGKGALTLLPGGYDFCHNEEEIIAKQGYNKDADPEYTSTSIFCAKGQGYKVPWDEAEAAMHCL